MATHTLNSKLFHTSISLRFFFSEHSGPAFEEFLSCIGQKVRLKGFEKYRAQLDNKSKQCYLLNCNSYNTSITYIL